MNDKRKGLLFQTKKQMNNGAIATGLGFVLYLALLAMGLELPAAVSYTHMTLPTT